MGLTDAQSNLIGAGISAGSGLVGGLVNNLFARNAAKQQYKYQRKLNAQQFEYQQQLNATQQEYSQQNAHNDYMRQRELTRDSYSLNQQGKRDAGINLAFTDGSQAVASTNPTAAPSAGSSSAGSAPNVQTFDTGIGGVGNVVQNYLQNMMQSRYQNEQISLLREQATNQRIQNLTQYQRDMASLSEKLANAKNADEHARYQKLYNDLSDKYLEIQMSADASAAESNADMLATKKAFYSKMQEAELRQKLADVENTLEDTKLKKSERIKFQQEKYLIEWQIRKLQHEIPYIDAQTQNVKENTKGVALDNDYKEGTLPYRIHEAVSNSSIAELKVIQEKLRTCPKDVRELLRLTGFEAYERIISGRGSDEDYESLAKLINMYNYDLVSGEIKSWLSSFSDALSIKAKSSKTPPKQSNNNPHVVTYSPQNY